MLQTLSLYTQCRINRNILECKGKWLGFPQEFFFVLIETYWNVKLCICDISLSVPSRINRNILECKEVTKTKTEAVAAGINRNILECKGRRCCYFNDRIVSINRNILECKAQQLNVTRAWSSVLIETYWNVKSADSPNAVIASGINRNILECKACCTWSLIPCTHSINRNILECKVCKRFVKFTRLRSINRNILECKGFPRTWIARL